MNDDERFIKLWNDYLEGDIDESAIAELRGLVAADDRRLQVAADSFQTHRLLGLIAEDSESRHDDFVRDTLARLPAEDDRFVGDVMRQCQGALREPKEIPASMSGFLFAQRTTTIAKTFALAVAAVVALIASVVFFQPKSEPAIARITELNGSLQWTGNGGQVVRDLDIGISLRGGTLESLSEESWAELEFHDGSTVTISGQSVLTVSEREQKELHLRDGSLSASVTPQPDGSPMLIHTPTAKLEVLGTQLNVDAEQAFTMLTVNEGRVRVTRLADGSVAEVPAEHQVVASVNRLINFKVQRRPEAISSWRSNLPTDATYGKWLTEPGARNGSVRATPMLVKYHKKPSTPYVAVLSVARGESPPVVLTSGGKFRIRGRIESAADVTFGLTTQHAKGGLAGKYMATQPIEAFGEADESFDIELPLADFHAKEHKLPNSPIGLELVDWWCCTYNMDAGVTITSVELIPAETERADPGLLNFSANTESVAQQEKS